MNKKRHLLLFGMVAFLIIAIALIYIFGIFLDFEYPYWWTLHKVAEAKSVNGVQISEILNKKFPATRHKIHWHTNGEMASIFGRLNESLVWVNFHDPDSTHVYYQFAYNELTEVLVPISKTTADKFPELFPSGDIFEDNPRFRVGDNDAIVFPRQWIKANTTVDAKKLPKGVWMVPSPTNEIPSFGKANG